MGVSEKHQVAEGGLDSESRRWMIAGIAFRSQLRPINTGKQAKESKITKISGSYGREEEYEEEFCATPTGRETRIPEITTCPAAPRKRRPAASATCHGVREFFNPPDLESVFVRHG